MKNLKTFIISITLLSLVGITIACGDRSGRTLRITTASQINDQQSLKNFVLDARYHAEKNYQKAIADFRDENGPWRHDEIYLMIFDDTGKVHFHAGIPSFENQRVGLKDLRTGQYLVDQLITEGLKTGGGYVEYHFDNPSTPEKEDSRKITYVTTLNRSDSGPILIIGAGFFPNN